MKYQVSILGCVQLQCGPELDANLRAVDTNADTNSMRTRGQSMPMRTRTRCEVESSRCHQRFSEGSTPWSLRITSASAVANPEPNMFSTARVPTVSFDGHSQSVNLFEIHRDAIHWFQNGHPMKSWITNSEEMLGVSEKQAEKFSMEWYNIKRQETSAVGTATRHSQR